ncbi:MAG: hypothetical protein U5R31_06250 [Acidimicrobiia bacterium]|nr:hypothetical protein [Acidimicrobiia bacterium]
MVQSVSVVMGSPSLRTSASRDPLGSLIGGCAAGPRGPRLRLLAAASGSRPRQEPRRAGWAVDAGGRDGADHRGAPRNAGATTARCVDEPGVDAGRAGVGGWDRLASVYGTLMPGHLRWPRIRSFVAAMTPAVVPGRLYDTGLGHPAAVFDVSGARDDPARRGWASTPAPGESRGRRTPGWTASRIPAQLGADPVTTTDGREAEAYEWQGPLEGLRRLDGRWTGD